MRSGFPLTLKPLISVFTTSPVSGTLGNTPFTMESSVLSGIKTQRPDVRVMPISIGS
ncbi:unannotated protein [freshwater metagenome]|uniref:Unannotated protein n=1 Tax=freshwater metagenome TaxID=449393 RepID=A0A6J6MG46_9ZZZZ